MIMTLQKNLKEIPVHPKLSVEQYDSLEYNNKDREGAGDGDPDWIIKKSPPRFAVRAVIFVLPIL